jgi:hypothetical protein
MIQDAAGAISDDEVDGYIGVRYILHCARQGAGLEHGIAHDSQAVCKALGPIGFMVKNKKVHGFSITSQNYLEFCN